MDHTNAAKMPDNTKLEKVLEAYAKEQNKDNLSAVLNGLRYAHLFVPAVFPEGTDLACYNAFYEIYLDAPERDWITCKAFSIYGEDKFSVFDRNVSARTRDIPGEMRVCLHCCRGILTGMTHSGWSWPWTAGPGRRRSRL